jgi:putative nucleotidyltransferase with HDIG domain
MANAVATVPTHDTQAIRKTFPLIAQIKAAKLRESVVKAWYIAWKESSFKNLEDAPFGLPEDAPVGVTPFQGDTLVKHTNAVASAALAMGRLLIQQYAVKINLDYVIAAAILHDLDKIVMYESKGGRIVHSELGGKIVHGAYGGHIALLAGLPQDIVFIIMAHSPKVDVELLSPEGKLVTFGDLGMLRTLQAATRKPPASGSHRETL